MTRVPTANYGADSTTQFQWATSDNDLFDRELDLYRLAQALENHTHEVARGLPVNRLATHSIVESFYGDLSISTRAIQDGAIIAVKIATGVITDDKLAVPKYPLTGGVVNGNVQVIPTAAPSTGYLFLGNGGSYIGFDGSTNIVVSPVGAAAILLTNDTRVYRASNNAQGYLFLGVTGAYVAYDGANIITNTGTVYTSGNSVMAPAAARVWFRTLAELTAAGAHWVRDTAPDGRLLVGYGAASGITPESFAENTYYGTTWAPLTAMGFAVTSGTLAVGSLGTSVDGSNIFLAAAASSNNSTGATNVNTSSHTHAVTGGALSGAPGMTNNTVHYLPPMMSTIWGVRV